MNFWSPLSARTRSRRRSRNPTTTVFDRFRDWNADVQQNRPRRKKNIQHLLDDDEDDDDCTPEPWHEDHYPNCNDIHAHRLASHLANGLWRDVFIVTHDFENAAVMKMMKKEHEVTLRNWDRHRRDAVVMEQLAGSPYVVDIYGYCGNTVVTERISPALSELVIEPEFIAPLPQRVLWARDMARGLAALHEKGIIHADIQAKQFLWQSEKGISKINDFNRCRFAERATPTKGNSTAAVVDSPFCPVRIGSAPGKQRSPEEYRNDLLTEKLDVYSYANILMALWTGHKAWDDYASAEAKRLIQSGFVPPSPFSAEASPQEEKLWDLTVATYARDPQNRPSAHEIATVLDHVLQELTG